MRSKKIKVAHVIYNLTIGGVTNIIQQLVTDKQEDTEHIVILLSAEAEAVPQGFEKVKVYKLSCRLPETYTIRGFAAIWLHPARYYRQAVEKLREVYEAEHFDIYHFHGIPKDLPAGTLLKKHQPDIRLVYTDHLMRIVEGEYSKLNAGVLAFIYRQFYKPYHVIFVSKAIAGSAAALGFLNRKKKNAVIENAVDVKAIPVKTEYAVTGKVQIVYVSRISAVKGHFLLLPVAELLINKYKFSNFVFVLIGPGELTDKLTEEIGKRGLTPFFKIEGPMQEVPAFLHRFDMAVFPSEREGLPVALLEKMAAGLPVVASSIPEIANVIQQEDEALLFPSKDAETCAALLHRLIQDETLRKRTGEAARKAVETRYSTPLPEKYSAFYQTLFQD